MGENMKIKSFAKLSEEAKQRDTYWVADAIHTFTEELHKLSENKGLSRTDLARLMGVSPAYITKIFRGNVNFTIDTMVRLARRVGARLQLHLVPEESEAYPCDWNDASETEPLVSGPAPQAPKRSPGKPFSADSGARKITVKAKTRPDRDHAEGE